MDSAFRIPSHKTITHDQQRAFARNIKQLMQRDELTVVEIAESVNVTTVAVYYWLNASSCPRMQTIEALACLFDVSVACLFDERVYDDEG
jgi:transcriptional regulator with XRE-family HTH domain